MKSALTLEWVTIAGSLAFSAHTSKDGFLLTDAFVSTREHTSSTMAKSWETILVTQVLSTGVKEGTECCCSTDGSLKQSRPDKRKSLPNHSGAIV